MTLSLGQFETAICWGAIVASFFLITLQAGLDSAIAVIQQPVYNGLSHLKGLLQHILKHFHCPTNFRWAPFSSPDRQNLDAPQFFISSFCTGLHCFSVGGSVRRQVGVFVFIAGPRPTHDHFDNWWKSRSTIWKEANFTAVQEVRLDHCFFSS